MNQAIHTLDLLVWILGEPKKVVGATFNRLLKGVIDGEDTACADYLGDNPFTLFATTSAPKDMPIELRFLTKNETIVVTPDSVKINGTPVDLESENKWYGKLSYGGGHAKLIKDFYDSVARGERFQIDGKEGAKAVRQVIATYISEGKVVDVR